jgi:hypothetical protein
MSRPRLGAALVSCALALGTAVVPLLTAVPAGATTATAAAFPDGTVVREENSFAIFQIVGGAAVWIPNAAEFYALGYTLDRVVVVPVGGLTGMTSIPRDGTLLRERSSFAVFIMDGGKARWIVDRDVFDGAGFTLQQVQVAANGSLGYVPRGPDLDFRALETTASAASTRCGPNSRLFGYAPPTRDGNTALIPGEGWRTWYVSVASKLWTCRGEVYAWHNIYVDSRYLPLGFQLDIRVSTRRSDGVWVGKDYRITTSKRFQVFSTYQYRGVGGGLRLTDVHVRHFPSPGQASVFFSSTAMSRYGPWNGPEASPRD